MIFHDRREPEYHWLELGDSRKWKLENLLLRLMDEDTKVLLSRAQCGWCDQSHATHILEGTLVPLCRACRRSEAGKKRRCIPPNSVIAGGGAHRPIKEEIPVFGDEDDAPSRWDAPDWVLGMERAEKSWRDHLMREVVAGEKTPTPRASDPGPAPQQPPPPKGEELLTPAEIIRRRKQRRIAGRP